MTAFYDNIINEPPARVKHAAAARQGLLRREVDDYFRVLALEYEAARDAHWQRDYSSLEAYAASVAPQRQAWQELIGNFPADEPLDPEIEPFLEDDQMQGWWVSLRIRGDLRARGVLALPKTRSNRLPLVIAQHGIGSSPEKVFGFDDEMGLYHAYGRRLAEGGFAVLAPMGITEGKPRARYTRMAQVLGGTLWGLEILRTRRLLDYCATREEIDSDRIGMWGISLGGTATMFTVPMEPRIKAGIVTAWFNDRIRKMVIEDPRYSCFLATTEEHAFLPGWLPVFGDADVASLICPRPLQIQTGKSDGIAWWPMVQAEFERARFHYEKLGIADRIELDLHDGGHEIRVDTGMAFLKRWIGA